MSQVHLADADANGLGFDRREERPVVVSAGLLTGFELGRIVIQHAHFSLTSAFETRHVSHVHLDELVPWLLDIFLNRLVVSGAAIAAIGSGAVFVGRLVDLGAGLADEQHAHLSAVAPSGFLAVSVVVAVVSPKLLNGRKLPVVVSVAVLAGPASVLDVLKKDDVDNDWSGFVSVVDVFGLTSGCAVGWPNLNILDVAGAVPVWFVVRGAKLNEGFLLGSSVVSLGAVVDDSFATGA